MKEKYKLYTIGGLSQVGKTTIADEMETKRGNLRVHHTDKMRRPPTPIEDKGSHVDDRAWFDALKLIEAYDLENSSDILFEGIAITPARVHDLKLKNLTLRAAFIGYSHESYAQIRIAHAKGTWLYSEMRRTGRGDAYVRDAMPAEILKNSEIEKMAREFGYGYFDAIKLPSFEERNQAIMDYLLRA